MTHKPYLLAGAAALSFALSGCGGGGGGGTAFIPQPPVQPPPDVTAAAAGTVGDQFRTRQLASSHRSGRRRRDRLTAADPLAQSSTNNADQPHIRFMSDGNYYVLLPGHEWNELVLYGQGNDPRIITDTDNNFEAVTSGSKDAGYRYSELASYRSSDPQQFGAFAFGALTPDGAVPVTGSATYNGTIGGSSDVVGKNAGQSFREIATGSVTLNFDFAAGTLAQVDEPRACRRGQ